MDLEDDTEGPKVAVLLWLTKPFLDHIEEQRTSAREPRTVLIRRLIREGLKAREKSEVEAAAKARQYLKARGLGK